MSENKTGIAENVAGLLAYVTFIPAIFFLVVAPYNKNLFVRFHAFQSIFFFLAWMVIWGGLYVLTAVEILGWAILIIWKIALVGLWAFLGFKAYQGEKFKLPIIGEVAQKQAVTVS